MNAQPVTTTDIRAAQLFAERLPAHRRDTFFLLSDANQIRFMQSVLESKNEDAVTQ